MPVSSVTFLTVFMYFDAKCSVGYCACRNDLLMLPLRPQAVGHYKNNQWNWMKKDVIIDEKKDVCNGVTNRVKEIVKSNRKNHLKIGLQVFILRID